MTSALLVAVLAAAPTDAALLKVVQARFDAVVIPRIMKVYLSDRVTEEWIEDAGHALIPEQPTAFVSAVCRFASSVHGNSH